MNTPTSPIDAIFDENNSDNICLYNQKGEPVVFEQIALIPLEGQVYVILKPVEPLAGMNPDEALAFLIATNEQGEEYLELCTDEEKVDQIFDMYDALLASES